MYSNVPTGSFFVAQFAFAKLSSNIPQLLHDVLSVAIQIISPVSDSVDHVAK
jgi:hypothetical protein